MGEGSPVLRPPRPMQGMSLHGHEHLGGGEEDGVQTQKAAPSWRWGGNPAPGGAQAVLGLTRRGCSTWGGGPRSALLQPQIHPSTRGGSRCHPGPPGLPVGAATSLLAETPRGDGGDIHSASHGEGSPQGARSSGTPSAASCPSGSPVPVRCDVLLQEGWPGWEGVRARRAIGTVVASVSPCRVKAACHGHRGPPGERGSAPGAPPCGSV